MKIFSGNANPELAEKIAKYLEMPLGEMEVSQFSDGETKVKIRENVRGADIFIVQPTCSPANQNLIELLIMIDAFKRASARRITALIPYYGYARQDKKDGPRVPITARLVADLLATAGVNKVMVIDFHAGQIQGFFNIPVDHLFAINVFVKYFSELGLKDLMIISPDAGGAERARAYAKRLKAGFGVIDKRRPAPNQNEVINIIGDVRDKNIIIVDDIVDTAGTLVKAAFAIKKEGAKEIFAACTHPVLSGEAIEMIKQSAITKLIVTDTIPIKKEKQIDKIKILSIAELLSEAARRVHDERSVSSLFD